MAKAISVDNETYKLIAAFAKEEGRPMSNALSRLVKIGLGISRPVNTWTAEVQCAAVSPAIKDDKPITLDGPEIMTDKTYDELTKEITEIKGKLDSDGLDDKRRKELENELRGLLVELAATEQ